MATPESKTKNIIKRELTKRKVFFFMPATGGYGVSGASDFVGCYRGKFFSIEAKAGANKPTALQIKFLVDVQTHGGWGIWVNEENAVVLVNQMLDEIDAWMEGV